MIICKEDYFVGLISIGDIQRALIHKIDLQEPVSKYIRDDILYCSVDDSIDEIKDRMRNERIECMPIVNNKKQLIDIIEWEDIFDKDDDKGQGKIQIPVVIMAGGEGKRLRPLTNIIPKPLIPISDKTIIEEIMDQFIAIGSADRCRHRHGLHHCRLPRFGSYRSTCHPPHHQWQDTLGRCPTQALVLA